MIQETKIQSVTRLPLAKRKGISDIPLEGVFTQFCVMPFRLHYASATFERLLENVLKVLAWKTWLVYVIDIIMVGKLGYVEHLVSNEGIAVDVTENQ